MDQTIGLGRKVLSEHGSDIAEFVNDAVAGPIVLEAVVGELLAAPQAIGKMRIIADATKSTAAETVTLDASSIRFSQSSVKPVLGEYVAKMDKGGWFGDPIDVVRMSDGGLTSIDNTRLAAAGITRTPVQAVIRDGGAVFPASRGPQFFGGATTWEEAALNRINSPGNKASWQNLYPNGSPFTGIRQGSGVIKQ